MKIKKFENVFECCKKKCYKLLRRNKATLKNDTKFYSKKTLNFLN